MSEIILTTYFTGKKDPQRKKQWGLDDYSIFKKWAESIKSHKINGIIFHDNLSNNFIYKHENDNIKFKRCDKNYIWSTNDFRFFVYRDYVNTNTDLQKIFMTDISDVVIKQNPFSNIKSDKIYAGYDNMGMIRWSKIKGFGLVPEYSSFWKTLENKKVINAGVVGGYREIVLSFLNKMKEQFEKINRPKENNNMAVFNYVMHKYFKNDLIVGSPVTSNFKRYENSRKDVWFIHK